MQPILRRTIAAASVVALATGLAACSEGEASETDTDSDAVTELEDANEVLVDSMVGLEVTAVGNVSDILSDEALRLDRDGLGNTEDQGEVGTDFDYDYDYDYYDYDELTEYDVDFGDDDLSDEGVLVVDATGKLQQRSVDEEVRVSGTIRRFDQDTIESVYEVDLEDNTYEDFEDALVIVADSVRPAGSAAANGSGASGTPSPTNGEG